MKKRNLRGADHMIESFYTTEYASRYLRPQTIYNKKSIKSTVPSFPSIGGTEFNDNTNRHSNKATVQSLTRKATSDINRLSAMERSGYWNQPSFGILYQTPAERRESEKMRSVKAASISSHTLKKMKAVNPIDAENHGTGPKWGSTTHEAAYQKYKSNNERFWSINRSLIGSKEQNSFTRQHLSISRTPIVDNVTTYNSTFTHKQRSSEPHIPQNCVVEPSGFTNSQIPTINHSRPLSDVTADQLHQTEVARLKKINTPEYQNLFNPNPYESVAHISYKQRR